MSYLLEPITFKAVGYMTNEEAIKILSDARDILIKANEIYGMHDFEKAKEAYDLAIKALEEPELPKQVNTDFGVMEQPEGKWRITRLQNNFDDVYCPFCNARPTRSEYGYYLLDKFCHDCGARLDGERF